MDRSGAEKGGHTTRRACIVTGVLGILVFLLVGAIWSSAGELLPLPSAAQMGSLRGDPTSASLSLWRDPHGDLWIKGPYYRWNITGGAVITTTFDGVEYPWRVSDQTGSIVDQLFLMAEPAEPISSQIFFALPDEALVYLERAAGDSSGREGLEIAFRSSDGLIRLTHRWLGDGQPMSSAEELSLSGQSKLSESAGSQSNRPAPGGYVYTALFDSAAGRGYATINARSVAAAPQNVTTPPSPSCIVNPGSAPPTAYDRCLFPGFFLPGRAIGTNYLFFYAFEPSAAIPSAATNPVQILLAALQLELPDLNAAYIMRTARYPYDATKNQPAPGEAVTFHAKIANRGGQASGPFAYTWFVDDVPVNTGSYPGLAPTVATTLTLDWAWQDEIHKVALVLDPANLITEVSEQNNRVEDRTNGLAVGFWVEQSVYDWMNLHQVELGLGSVSWEDWAQRQLRVWNQMLATAIHPLTPEGAIDRLRLDKVIIVPDNSLPRPYPGNYPDTSDKTVDLMWGFAYELVLPPNGWYLNDPTPLNVEYSLLHELSHARYLMDLYGLNVVIGALHLQAAVDSTVTTLSVPNAGGVSLPAYLAIDREMVVCSAYAAPAFSGCERGAGGTTARSHAANALVNLAVVRLQDGQGNLVQGGPDLPIVSIFNDHIYYNINVVDLYNLDGEDLMNGGHMYVQHSAYAWNRIAGRRPVCGNYNAPCNLGEYANDLPMLNVVELRGEDEQPLAGAQVELYRRREAPGLYGKLFDAPPDMIGVTDGQGQVDFGHDMFSTGRIWTPEGVCLIKILAGGKAYYRFLEVTVPNESYWSGKRDRAEYLVKLGLTIANKAPAVTMPMEPITYTLTVRNTGKVVATNVVVTSTIPSGATYVSGGTHIGNMVQWTLGSLAPQESTAVQFVVEASQTITNADYGARADGGMIARGHRPVVTVVMSIGCYTLTKTANPAAAGTVNASAAWKCNGGMGYTSGAVVQLTAVAKAGYTFRNWSGDAAGNGNPTTVTMTGNKTVVANFVSQVYLPLLLR